MPEQAQSTNIIPEENRQMFWVIERGEEETLLAFIKRCWEEAHGAPTTKEDAPQTFQAEVVRDGYASPYQFAILLRDLAARAEHVNDGPAFGVWGAHNVQTGGAVYYCWDDWPGEEPTRCAFYDPSKGPTFGRRPDFFEDVDKIGEAVK